MLAGISVDRPGIARLGLRCGVLLSGVLRDRVAARVVLACRIAVGLSRWLVVRWRRSILAGRCRMWVRLGVRECVGLGVVVDVGAVAVVFAVVGRRLRVFGGFEGIGSLLSRLRGLEAYESSGGRWSTLSLLRRGWSLWWILRGLGVF